MVFIFEIFVGFLQAEKIECFLLGGIVAVFDCNVHSVNDDWTEVFAGVFRGFLGAGRADGKDFLIFDGKDLRR